MALAPTGFLPHTTVLSLFLVLSIAAAPLNDGNYRPFRAWTSSGGDSIEASLESVDGDIAILRTRKNRLVKIHKHHLSIDDQFFLEYGATLIALEKQADQGDVESQVMLAIAYQDGKVLPKDYAKNVAWLRRATGQSGLQSPELEYAMYMLGRAYRLGQGVPKNDDEALRWLLQADSVPAACGELGFVYEGREQYEAAIQWFTKGAQIGDPRCQGKLGICYLWGEYVDQDYSLAITWLEKAAGQGYCPAIGVLGDLYRRGEGVERDYRKAVELLTEAANNGNTLSKARLGRMYYFGEGVPQHFAKAKIWCEQAANEGNGDAQKILGIMYAHGAGVPVDKKLAYAWISLSLLSGSTDSLELGRKVRDDIADALSADELREAQELATKLYEQICGRK